MIQESSMEINPHKQEKGLIVMQYYRLAYKKALEFIIDSANFLIADNHVSFYELFILWL